MYEAVLSKGKLAKVSLSKTEKQQTGNYIRFDQICLYSLF